jgi:hypothetical protein
MGRRVDRSGFETMYSAFVCVRVPRGWTSSGNGCFASKTPTAGNLNLKQGQILKRWSREARTPVSMQPIGDDQAELVGTETLTGA